MYLVNFSPVRDTSEHGWGRALRALGTTWDLHNYAGFEGFDYAVSWTDSASLTLKWRIPASVTEWARTYGVPNPEGVPVYPGTRFAVVFTAVDYLEVSPRDPVMPGEEDATLDAVGCLEASANSKEFRDEGWFPNYDPADGAGPFHFMFRFWGGQFIRVGAEKAEFVLLDEAASVTTA